MHVTIIEVIIYSFINSLMHAFISHPNNMYRVLCIKLLCDTAYSANYTIMVGCSTPTALYNYSYTCMQANHTAIAIYIATTSISNMPVSLLVYIICSFN